MFPRESTWHSLPPSSSAVDFDSMAAIPSSRQTYSLSKVIPAAELREAHFSCHEELSRASTAPDLSANEAEGGKDTTHRRSERRVSVASSTHAEDDWAPVPLEEDRSGSAVRTGLQRLFSVPDPVFPPSCSASGSWFSASRRHSANPTDAVIGTIPRSSVAAAGASSCRVTRATCRSAMLKGSSAAKKGRDLHVEVSEAEIRSRVREALSPISLSDAQMTELLQLAERRTYPRYATVIREGAAGNHAFVLVHGVLNVHRVRHGVTLNHVATPGPYGLFGESGMQSGADGTPITSLKRAATATVTSEVAIVLIITHTTLELLDPAGRKEMLRGLKQHYVSKILKLAPFFCTVPDRDLRQLAECLEIRCLNEGDYIFRQGDLGNQMSILVDGKVSIVHDYREAGEDISTTLAVYTPQVERPWFGEVILWMDAPHRFGNAICSEETLIFELPISQVDVFNQYAPSFRAYCLSASQSYVRPEGQKAANTSYLPAWVRMVGALLNVNKLTSTAMVHVRKARQKETAIEWIAQQAELEESMALEEASARGESLVTQGDYSWFAVAPEFQSGKPCVVDGVTQSGIGGGFSARPRSETTGRITKSRRADKAWNGRATPGSEPSIRPSTSGLTVPQSQVQPWQRVLNAEQHVKVGDIRSRGQLRTSTACIIGPELTQAGKSIMIRYTRACLQDRVNGYRRQLASQAAVDTSFPSVNQPPRSKENPSYSRVFIGSRFDPEPYQHERFACPRPRHTLHNGLSPAATYDLPWPRDFVRLPEKIILKQTRLL